MSDLCLADRTKVVSFSIIRSMLAKSQELKEKGYSIYDCSAGKPDFNTPNHIIEKTKKALDDGLGTLHCLSGDNGSMQSSLFVFRKKIWVR